MKLLCLLSLRYLLLFSYKSCLVADKFGGKK
jgi:hypothetical protein